MFFKFSHGYASDCTFLLIDRLNPIMYEFLGQRVNIGCYFLFVTFKKYKSHIIFVDIYKYINFNLFALK